MFASAVCAAGSLCGSARLRAAITAAPDPVREQRVALVVGNGNYVPAAQSIPSSAKNTGDVAEALENLGFQVRKELDLSADALRRSLQEFFAPLRRETGGAPPLGVFYYTGHGIQFGGENFIVPGDVRLDQSAEAVARSSISIDRELLAQPALPNDGAAALIFDACRNDPTRALTDRSGTFNQVNPPKGIIISFSTAPGRFAIAPRSPNENSMYTAVLVDELKKTDAAMSLKDFLDAVKFRVKRQMEESADPFLRAHAQDPEVAANLRLRMPLALQAPQRALDDAEERAWTSIEQTLLPRERAELLRRFIAEFGNSRYLPTARVLLERALATETAIVRSQVPVERVAGDADFKADQAKALDGDKDAAYRLAQMFRNGSNGVVKDERRMVQWLRHASELRNGIASYELYLYFRDRGIDREAVRYDNLSCALGYSTPQRLGNSRGGDDVVRHCP